MRKFYGLVFFRVVFLDIYPFYPEVPPPDTNYVEGSTFAPVPITCGTQTGSHAHSYIMFRFKKVYNLVIFIAFVKQGF